MTVMFSNKKECKSLLGIQTTDFAHTAHGSDLRELGSMSRRRGYMRLLGGIASIRRN